MGQCAGTNQKKKTPIQSFWKEPEDTYKYQKMDLPKLSFQGTLGNFKIKNCSYPQLSIKVDLSGIETFFLKQKKIKSDMSATWQFEQKFVFSKTIYELKKAFIQIYFEDEEEKVVGELRVNMFLISIGPYHQDFAIKLSKGANTRISFDLKLSQIIELQLESLQTEIDFITKHPDQIFNFSIKTIVGSNATLEVNSRRSYDAKVMLEGDDSLSQQSQNSKVEKGKLAKKIIKADKNLSWSNKICEIMPSIGIKTLVSELHHSYFQIIIWKINDKKISSTKEEKPQIFGECFIAFHKMFTKDPEQDQTNYEKEVRVISTSQKIWYNGRQIGKGLFKFRITNQKYSKQMQVMVRTEQGIRVYSPVLFQKSKNKSSRSEQLAKIIKISQCIETLAEKLDQLQSKPQIHSIASRKIKVDLQNQLEQLLQILLSSSKNMVDCFSYSSQEQLLKSQQIFVQIGFKMTQYLEQEDIVISQLCWKILTALLRRQQLGLSYIRFSQQEKQHIKSGNLSSELERKVELALNYQKFLNKQLQVSLKSLSLKGQDIEQIFSEMFLAHAYFRIPFFRIKLLQSIVDKNDPDIAEWRGIEFSLHEDILEQQFRQSANTFNVFFDWQNTFYKCIQKEEKALQNFNELEQILENNQWKQQMKQRDLTFFYFIIHWVEYIQKIGIKTKQIQWKYFPGYNKLIKCFLVQMKKRPIIQYPDALKGACFKLMYNEKLLNPFISIILGKGNIYEPLTILKAIQLINQILTELSKSKKKIPGSFNYYQMYKAIKIILQGDFSFAVSKTLLMIYTHYKMFHLEFRRNIGMLLLGKVFFKIFLHWSHNVRDIFFHLILMRLFKESLTLDQTLTGDMRIFQEKMNQQMRSRYKNLIRIIEKANSIKSEEKKQKLRNKYEKNLYKSLKTKLYEKKKKKKQENIVFQKKEYDQISYCVITEPPFSPMSAKNQMNQFILQEKYSLNQLSKNKRIERSNSDIVKPTIKFSKKQTIHHDNQQVRRLKKTSSDFKHQIYDIQGGKKVPLSKGAQIINQYQEGDFEIAQISYQQIQYIEAALNQFKKVRQILQTHSNEKDWSIPNIKMEMRLDIRESRPQKIDSY